MLMSKEDYEIFSDEDIVAISKKHISVQCPQCKRQYNLIHQDCGDYTDYCSCSGEDIGTQYHCGSCLVSFDVKEGWSVSSEYMPLFEDDGTTYFDDISVNLPKTHNYGGFGVWDYQFLKECEHKLDEVELFDGTIIHCSSVHGKNEGISPDFGLYADFLWRPTWRNEFITWPDGSCPTNSKVALEQIKEAYELAQADKIVEIGCIGGHGRTGTILACMQLLAGDGTVTATQAVKFVHEKYCINAIETSVQHWWIEYASHVWFGSEIGEKPKDPADPGGCSLIDHFVMMERGHLVCMDKGLKCKEWAEDWARHDKLEEVDSKIMQFVETKLPSVELMYGGKKLVDDFINYPCSPLDHYAMMMKGHNECIRLPGQCDLWEDDIKEYIEKGSMGQVSFTGLELEGEAKIYYDAIPSVEEFKEKENE